ncbi:hypothetical protein FisN_38Hh033 [Fistulifera solaris]|uniref:Uncharacterized protein n=1 Tax=Fistulifera solaris TaxID=1519565 RepID=A0A1Z5KQ83_FISSO|nr:hypothetical protein FisN_38Hh033 [Fistulifera solaris]|eukprot:GAX28474.1 hypothetical protein FisN_38Hh033 [Fistulifera solaris]
MRFQLCAMTVLATTVAAFVPHASFSRHSMLHGKKKHKNHHRAGPARLPPVNETSGEFVNDGSFAWMAPYLTAIGIEPGKTIKYGPIAFDAYVTVSAEEAEQRKAQATLELVNIGPDERERRSQASRVMYFVAVLYTLWATFLGDDGSFAGHVFRFLTVIPFFLAYGYQRSAETAL